MQKSSISLYTVYIYTHIYSPVFNTWSACPDFRADFGQMSTVLGWNNTVLQFHQSAEKLQENHILNIPYY